VVGERVAGAEAVAEVLDVTGELAGQGGAYCTVPGVGDGAGIQPAEGLVRIACQHKGEDVRLSGFAQKAEVRVGRRSGWRVRRRGPKRER
jgi:hypothetical protein